MKFTPLALLIAGTLVGLSTGAHVAGCANRYEIFVAAWAYKPCDTDRADFDCIELAGTHCDEDEEQCTCWNEDGTKPAPGTLPDQLYCQGACIPFRDCPFTRDAGAEATTMAPEPEPEPECAMRSDCPQPPSAQCGKATCTTGVCELELRKPAPIDSQIRGDCQTSFCDPLGQLVLVEDPADYYDDGNPCTLDMCIDGVPTNQQKPDGSDCTSPGSGYCFQGECVECIFTAPHTYCGELVCIKVHCVPSSCVECGAECDPCVTAESCSTHADCLNGVCVGGTCASPTCKDKVQNDGETGQDCGGPCAETCADGLGCKTRQDCESGVCWSGTCQAPTCTDGVLNGTETGKDCGGPCGPCL